MCSGAARWLEVMGCGMVDPAVLEGMGLDSGTLERFRPPALGVERFCIGSRHHPYIRASVQQAIAASLEQF